MVRDAETTFYGMIADAIKIDARWRQRWVKRLKPLDEMTSAEREAFFRTMNRRMPRKLDGRSDVLTEYRE